MLQQLLARLPYGPQPSVVPPANCLLLPTSYQTERDELAGQLGTAEAELQNTQDCLEHAR